MLLLQTKFPDIQFRDRWHSSACFSQNFFCVLSICFPIQQVAKSIPPTKSLGLVDFLVAFFLNMQWATTTFSHIRIQSATHLIKQSYIRTYTKEISYFFHCELASLEQINIWRIKKYKRGHYHFPLAYRT